MACLVRPNRATHCHRRCWRTKGDFDKQLCGQSVQRHTVRKRASCIMGLSPGAPNSCSFCASQFFGKMPQDDLHISKMNCYGSIPGLPFSTSINLLAPFQDVLQLPLLLSSVFTCCVWRHVCTPKRFFMYFRLPKVCILCSIAPKTMNCFVFFLSWGHLIFFVSFLETVLELSILYRDIGQTPEMYFSIVPMCTPCMIRET